MEKLAEEVFIDSTRPILVSSKRKKRTENVVEESRRKIVDELQELQDACNRIAPEFCHSKCPYEDICLKLRCVGYGCGLKIQPCDWKLEELR